METPLASGDSLALGETPINCIVLASYLRNYEHKLLASELINGFVNGFYLHYSGPRIRTEARNHVSVRDSMPSAGDLVATEIKLGRMAGPFKIPPLITLEFLRLVWSPRRTEVFD